MLNATVQAAQSPPIDHTEEIYVATEKKYKSGIDDVLLQISYLTSKSFSTELDAYSGTYGTTNPLPQLQRGLTSPSRFPLKDLDISTHHNSKKLESWSPTRSQ